jgi:hypothetical protein
VDDVVDLHGGIARLELRLRLGADLGVAAEVLNATVGDVVVERLFEVLLVVLPDELLEEVSHLRLLVGRQRAPVIRAAGLGCGARLTESATRELVVVDDGVELALDLRGPRG